MNVLTLKSIEKNKFTMKGENKIGKHVVLLPGDWWFTKNTFTLDDNKETPKYSYLLKTDVSKLKLIQNEQWTVKKGDYFVKTDNKEKDYGYYRQLKERVMKLLLFPFIIISVYTIYVISEFLSRISF